MDGKIVIDAFSYTGYALEAGLLVYLVVRGHARRLLEIVFYLVTSLGVIGARSYTLYRYGLSSHQYGACYWATDLLLVLAAFVVVTCFFRRAISDNKEMWRHIRLLLGVVFAGIAAISFISLSGHNDRIFSFFIVEFSQNLYFACLVLTTLLYLMTLKMAMADDRLGLLVCGLGIEFAGPAACLAFYYLTGGDVGRSLGVYLFPLFDIGMILTWFYAVSRVPEAARVRPSAIRASRVFAEESISHF